MKYMAGNTFSGICRVSTTFSRSSIFCWPYHLAINKYLADLDNVDENMAESVKCVPCLRQRSHWIKYSIRMRIFYSRARE